MSRSQPSRDGQKSVLAERTVYAKAQWSAQEGKYGPRDKSKGKGREKLVLRLVGADV